CTRAVENGGCGAKFGLLAKKNSYSACLCCADTGDEINKTLEAGGSEGYSLVERIFYGTRSPQSGGLKSAQASESAEAIENVIKAFRDMYGDITIVSENSKKGLGINSDKILKRKFVLPGSSIPQKIHLFRDGQCNSK